MVRWGSKMGVFGVRVVVWLLESCVEDYQLLS